jgi:hypothetical protein
MHTSVNATPLFTLLSAQSSKSYLSNRSLVGVGSPKANPSHPALTLAMYISPQTSHSLCQWLQFRV